MISPAESSRTSGQPSQDVVVLTHGFMAHRIMLKLLAARLRRAGWETRIWGYESCLTSVTRHADRFAGFLGHLQADDRVGRIHLAADVRAVRFNGLVMDSQTVSNLFTRQPFNNAIKHFTFT